MQISIGIAATALSLTLSVSSLMAKTFDWKAVNEIRQDLSANPKGLDVHPDFKEYLEHYKMDPAYFSEIRMIKAGSYQIATYHFKVPDAKGTFVLGHGFYDQTGYMYMLMDELKRNNFNVISFDLPGHGLSNGMRSKVDSFDSYAVALKEVVSQTKDLQTDKTYYMGFSTGAVGIITHLLQNDDLGFEKIFFVAPLVDVYMKRYLDKANYLLSRTTEYIPRFKTSSTSNNPDFFTYRDSDALTPDFSSTQWYTQFVYWNRKIWNTNVVIDADITVIQGTADKTVDHEKGIEWMTKHVRNPKFVIIENGPHQLLLDTDEVRNTVFSTIIEGTK